MASKRLLQQFLDGEDAKGKMVMLEGGEDKNKEVADDDLDPWEKAAKEYPPPEDTSKWRPWTARQDLIIFMGACHAREVLRQQMLEGQNIEDEDPVDDAPEVIFEYGTPEDDQEAHEDIATVADQDDAAIQEDVDPALPDDPSASNAPSVADPSSDHLSTN